MLVKYLSLRVNFNYLIDVLIMSATRLEVLKTYKIYIGGQFPRTESGRYYPLADKKGKHIANVCLSSRKDLRNAIVEARKAFGGWSARAAFNRSQILYRVAEILEGRRAQFVAELAMQGSSSKAAENELDLSIDRLVYFAGWCDKISQVFSTINPVASSHFNFSTTEPMGVVSIIAPEETSLLGLVSVIAPVIAGGNTCVVLASESKPLSSVSFAEVLNASDIPGGVVNILTGMSNELASWFASHMDVNAMIYCRKDSKELEMIQQKGVENFKRVFDWSNHKFDSSDAENPYLILDTLEIKTTWHPIENIGASKAGY
jgi:acyl-CoA reductase-like NAD-dependent aldehyde dehydrogenase